jgi:3-phosphoinositide dependent protein kinase-1
MNALRSHPFFFGIDWKTLWTAPVPPLEPGLVKKDQKEGRASGQWDDMGAVWDELVDSGRDEDEISWASDEDRGEEVKFGAVEENGNVNGVPYAGEVGPKGETHPLYTPSASIPVGHGNRPGSKSGSSSKSGRGTPRPSNATNGHNNANSAKTATSKPGTGTGSGVRFVENKMSSSDGQTAQLSTSHGGECGGDNPDSGVEADEDRDIVSPTLDNLPSEVKTQPIDVPFVPNGLRDSYSTGSATSSSDGSPPGSALDAALTIARGRNRTQTPIQGNEPARDDEEWYVELDSLDFSV